MSSQKSLLLLTTVGCFYAKSGDVAACRVVFIGLYLKSVWVYTQTLFKYNPVKHPTVVNNNSEFSEDIVTPWRWSKTETCRSFLDDF